MPAKRKHEHWDIPGEEGYIFGKGKKKVKNAYMRFGDSGKKLGFAFLPRNKRLGLKILKEEQERRKLIRAANHFGLELPAHLQPKPEAEPKPEGVIVSLHQLIKEFETLTYRSVSRFVKSHYRSAISHYVDFECQWDRLDEKQRLEARLLIRDQLVERHNSGELAVNTLEKCYRKMYIIFDHIVTDGALDKNPMDVLWKPKRERGSKRWRWLPEEAEIIVYWMEQIQKRTRKRDLYSETFRLLLMSGIRDGELLKITREEARGDFFTACSKVLPNQREEDVRRQVIINSIPGLRECLNRLLALPESSRRPGMLYPETNLNTIREIFNEAVMLAGIKRVNRTLNCARKSCIWWLENELGWSRQNIFDMIGHDEEVDDQYYREVAVGSVLEARIHSQQEVVAIESQRSQDQAPNVASARRRRKKSPARGAPMVGSHTTVPTGNERERT